jgi:hypothetical protein
MIITAPEPLPNSRVNRMVPRSVFLAGSIEMGKATDWQSGVEKYLDDRKVTVFNPRRKDWDSSWTQEASNKQFSDQVNWELTALDISSCIFLYFDPATKSPISLLELGLFAHSNKIIVGCPDGFYRKGNVQIVCNRYKIPFFTGKDCNDVIQLMLTKVSTIMNAEYMNNIYY